MAEVIKQEFPIAVLVLTIERAGGVDRRPGKGPYLKCQVQVDGETRETLELSGAELGLPATFEEAGRYLYSEPSTKLPAVFVARLRQLLQDVIEMNRPLWLQLDYPNGVLPLVPWERLLSQVAPWPVLRMPYHVTRPESSPETLDVALIATSPDPERRFAVEELVERHLLEITGAVPADSHVHVFADLATATGLQGRWGSAVPPGGRATLHDPRNAPRLRESGEAPADASEAWFEWIARALEGRSVDVLHFVAHGYVGSNQGMLVLADAPENPPGEAGADVIGARAIHSLARSIGAWCTVLTAPPTNYSVLGQRLLADALARQRPGPVGLLQFHSGSTAGAIGQAYAFLCGFTTQVPLNPDQLIYVHPARTGTPEQLARAANPAAIEWNVLPEGLSAASGSAAEMLRKGRGAPQWLASYQRGLEQAGSTIAQSNRRPLRSTPSAAERGAEEALRFLAKAIHSRVKGPGEEGVKR